MELVNDTTIKYRLLPDEQVTQAGGWYYHSDKRYINQWDIIETQDRYFSMVGCDYNSEKREVLFTVKEVPKVPQSVRDMLDCASSEAQSWKVIMDGLDMGLALSAHKITEDLKTETVEFKPKSNADIGLTSSGNIITGDIYIEDTPDTSLFSTIMYQRIIQGRYEPGTYGNLYETLPEFKRIVWSKILSDDSEGMFLAILEDDSYAFFHATEGSCGYNGCSVSGATAQLYVGTLEEVYNFGMNNMARHWHNVKTENVRRLL